MPTLSEYTNVHTSALAAIKAKGFSVWFDAASDMYWAEKSGWDLTADSPIALLGLVAMLEWIDPNEYSEYWWRIASPDQTKEQFLTEKPDYISKITAVPLTPG